MTKQAPDSIAINLFGCNASDDAWANDLAPALDAFHPASISQATYDAIVTARKALDANPTWECIAIASDMECKTLEEALDDAGLWHTGTEEFLICRFPGLYLRLLHKHNRQAEIEFEVAFEGGNSIPTPHAPHTAGAAAVPLQLYFLSDDVGEEHNHDLFVWARCPAEATGYWRAHYAGDVDDREPDHIWTVPTAAAAPGALPWNSHVGLLSVAP
jgi:hypothetical protein